MPGHAGTVPMAGRSDALVAAAEYVLHVREIADGIDGAVAYGRAASRSSPEPST